MLAQVIRNQDDELEIVNLAGAQSDGLPLGSIIPLHTTKVPAGFLPCNGTSFDRAQYPALYTLLGTDVLPDLRELALVGAGQNTTCTITAHDVYSVGQFKDDQLQDHDHYLKNHNIPADCVDVACNNITCTADGIYKDVTSNSFAKLSVGNIKAGRTGNTTHGKQYGVLYVIKAVTGKIDIDDAAVYREIVDLLQSNYLDKTVLIDKAIVSYDEASGELSSIPLPVGGNKILVAAPDGTYSWSDPAMGAVWNSPDVCATINTCYSTGCVGNASDFRFVSFLRGGGKGHRLEIGCNCNCISDYGYNYLGQESTNPDFGSVITGLSQEYCKLIIGEELQLSDCDYHISMGACNGFFNYGGVKGTCTLAAGNANVFLGNCNTMGFCSGDACGWDSYLGNNDYNVFIGTSNCFKTKVDEECTNAHVRNIVLGNNNTGYIAASNVITGNLNCFCGDVWEPMGSVIVYGNRNTLCNPTGDYSNGHVLIGTCNGELTGGYSNIMIGGYNKVCCGNYQTLIGSSNCTYGYGGVDGGVAMGHCALIGRINSAVWIMEHHRYTEGGPHGTIRFHIPANQMNCDIRTGLRCLMKDFINRGWCNCTWTCQGVYGSFNVPTTKGRMTGYYYCNSSGENNVGNNTICKWDDIMYIDGTGNTACSNTSVATWIDSCNCTVRTQCFSWPDNTNRWACGLSGTLWY